MDPGTDQSGNAATQVGVPDLARLCRLLNGAGVRYLVYGGLACLLHGHERMTRDADIFLGEERDNISCALSALKKWGEGYARELTAEDVLDSAVVRVCDVFVLDLASRVWKIEWESAWRHRRELTIDGVSIPFLCREDLIRSKRTYREQDKWDVAVLLSMTGPEPGAPGAMDQLPRG